MAELRILYHPEVIRRDMPSLDPPVRKRIKIAIEQRLGTHPEEFAKPLAYNKSGLWSLQGEELDPGVPPGDRLRQSHHLFLAQTQPVEVLVVLADERGWLQLGTNSVSQLLDRLQDLAGELGVDGAPDLLLALAQKREQAGAARMLAIHEAGVAADLLVRDRLVHAPEDPHPVGMDPRFVGIDVAADHRLLGLHRDAGEVLDQLLGDLQPLGVEARDLQAVEIFEGGHDAVQRGIARPFAEAVDGGRKDVETTENAGDGVDRRQAEVIMEVGGALDSGESRGEPAAVVPRRLRSEAAGGVGEDVTAGAGVDRGAGDVDQQIERRAARILDPELDPRDPPVYGIACHLVDHLPVGCMEKRQREIAYVRGFQALPLEQHGTQLVFDVQAAPRGEQQEGHLVEAHTGPGDDV